MSSLAPRRATVYLESRYRKLRRGLPQTVFYCPKCKGNPRRRLGCKVCEGRGKLAEDSVEEIVGRVVRRAFQARGGKFHGAGREDLDVLMLGQGRPFVFEVVGAAHTDVDLERLLTDIHAAACGRVALAPLRVCDRARVAFWKGAELDKTYRARVAIAGQPAIEAATLVGRRIDVDQRTPARVAHRRGDAVRARWVEVRAIEAAGESTLDVVLRCAHGTYVKEWISGDDGRTAPSLASLLGVAATCAQLDVLAVGDPASVEPSDAGPPPPATVSP